MNIKLPVSIKLLIFALWFVPSIGQFLKYFGFRGAILAAALVPLAISASILRLPALRSERLKTFHAWLPVALMLMAAVLFAVFFPIAKSGLLGPGSDREDALNVAIRALLHGSYPYYSETYLGNPPTPAPGALLLALPFYLIGTSALQNLFWVPFFIYYCCNSYFRDPLIAAGYLLTFVLACPGSLQDFVTGGDYLVNAVYVGIAVDLVMRAHRPPSSRAMKWMAYAFLAAAISSRAIYGVAVPVLAGFVWQQSGLRASLSFLGVVSVIVLAFNGPFYAYDPSHFTPLMLARKLAAVPDGLHPAVLLPLISIVLASLSAFLALNRQRAFAAIAWALVPPLVLPVLFGIIEDGGSTQSLIGSSYTLPISLFGGLFLFARIAKIRSPTNPIGARKILPVD
jgi:hypothetical protein